MISWLAVLSPALADDLFAVAPYRDGAVLATVWHEHLELWVVDADGVRAHAAFPDEDRVTNPSIGCGTRGCWVAWTAFDGDDGTGRVATIRPAKPTVLAPVDLGPATRVLVLPGLRDAKLAVERLPTSLRADDARDAAWRTVDAAGQVGPPQVFNGGPVAPSTLQADGDGVRYRAPGRRERWFHEAFGAAPVDAEPLARIPVPVCADGQVCEGGPRSAGLVLGRGGVRAWVMRDGAVHVGGPGWSTPVETLSEARASWVARAQQSPATDPNNDGTEPFFVPTYVREVHVATLSLSFTGAVTGTTTARSAPEDIATSRLRAGSDEVAVGELVAMWAGRAGGLRPSVRARLTPGELAVTSACGALTAVELDKAGLRLLFERGEAAFPAPALAQLTVGEGRTESTGPWSGPCLTGDQAIAASWSVGAVLAATADEMGHFGVMSMQ